MAVAIKTETPIRFAFLRKRDGRVVDFDQNKITEAIFKAIKAVGGNDKELAFELTVEVLKELKKQFNGEIFGVEDVQDTVEKILIKQGHATTAKAYILYRAERTRQREAKSDLMDTMAEILKETHRENANIGNSPSAKMLQIASAASKHYYLTRVIPEEYANAHRNGDIHIHDLDFYGKTLTCVQIPVGELLEKGFNTGHGFIRPPKRPGSATALTSIIIQSSQNDMHGGQAVPFLDRYLAPYFEDASEEECYQACEALIYNLNSMHSRAGAQVPFSSLNLGADTSKGGRKVIRNILLAYEKGLGHGENPIFPNIIFRLKEGINFNPGDPNYDLFQLAMRVTSKRMNPTYSFMDSSFNSPYGVEASYMGCRTRVIANRKGPAVTEKRGNLSFTTINLPRLAIKAINSNLHDKTINHFYKLLDKVLDLAARQLYHRYRIQSNLKVKDMPFLMGQKLYLGSEKLNLDDTIEEAIQHGTLSIGFIGLAEALKMLIGFHHGETLEAQALGLEIVSYMHKKIQTFSEEYDLNYSLLATPAESLSGRFIALDQKEFGIIPGVTDKEYYTNSFHVPVSFPISIFDKISIEGPYHKYCEAGHISYVELSSSPQNNIEAIESILKHMALNDMGYAGINFPIDQCAVCHYIGVINSENCPVCKNKNIRRIRRITGYFSTTTHFGKAKLAELRDRIAHIKI